MNKLFTFKSIFKGLIFAGPIFYVLYKILFFVSMIPFCRSRSFFNFLPPNGQNISDSLFCYFVPVIDHYLSFFYKVPYRIFSLYLFIFIVFLFLYIIFFFIKNKDIKNKFKFIFPFSILGFVWSLGFYISSVVDMGYKFSHGVNSPVYPKRLFEIFIYMKWEFFTIIFFVVTFIIFNKVYKKKFKNEQ